MPDDKRVKNIMNRQGEKILSNDPKTRRTWGVSLDRIWRSGNRNDPRACEWELDYIETSRPPVCHRHTSWNLMKKIQEVCRIWKVRDQELWPIRRLH